MTTPFIHPDFLLQGKTAQALYHEFAADQPILDYHTHLSPGDIASNRQFANLYEIWLEGDHYKWRAMRTNGISEEFCTGDAKPREKFNAWASTVPHTLRNPLFHWTHLELKRYFDIDTLLNEKSADAIWEKTNAQLASPEFSTHGILKRFNVRAVCTTDDPSDDLEAHRSIAESDLPTRVFPTFRPDRATEVHKPAQFNDWLDRLGQRADCDIRNLDDLFDALKKRHDAFHAIGCRLSDHSLDRAHAEFCSESDANAIFNKARSGNAASPEEHDKFISNLMLFFGHLDAERNWTKQLHLGALRNNNSRLFKITGADAGFDSMDDLPQARKLSAYLNQLDSTNQLPRVILYNLNPTDNYTFGAMTGNFQDGSVAAKVQHGSGWWFLDQKEGIQWQLNALSNLGLLSKFVGMLTDSRSFMSMPRHEYFRRILCNLLGNEIDSGELPNDTAMVGGMISDICYHNAREFLQLPGVPND